MTAYACLCYQDGAEALRFLQVAFGFEAESVHRGWSASTATSRHFGTYEP